MDVEAEERICTNYGKAQNKLLNKKKEIQVLPF